MLTVLLVAGMFEGATGILFLGFGFGFPVPSCWMTSSAHGRSLRLLVRLPSPPLPYLTPSYFGLRLSLLPDE